MTFRQDETKPPSEGCQMKRGGYWTTHPVKTRNCPISQWNKWLLKLHLKSDCLSAATKQQSPNRSGVFDVTKTLSVLIIQRRSVWRHAGGINSLLMIPMQRRSAPRFRQRSSHTLAKCLKHRHPLNHRTVAQSDSVSWMDQTSPSSQQGGAENLSQRTKFSRSPTIWSFLGAPVDPKHKPAVLFRSQLEEETSSFTLGPLNSGLLFL